MQKSLKSDVWQSYSAGVWSTA